MPALAPVTALEGNVSLLIPTRWVNHQKMQGWASDCNGCSYSEPGDYFGEDPFPRTPPIPPDKGFCTVRSKITPESFQRTIPFKPDAKEESRVLKQKDPSASEERIVVSLENKTLEVSYRSRPDEKSPAYYYKSVTYFGPNRRVQVSFKGKDNPEFRETVAAMRNSIRIKSAFLNEEIDK
ncbi:hypothetical protein [Hymenobacter sp. IS2118]|uniref:hypothetical protein n=1 Tax=Hymenobacter sp. IS2118 TaxID=1505605 RepID=UPI0012683F92|nr:hypothetical protein [Hymenobacter sp. IS2118]